MTNPSPAHLRLHVEDSPEDQGQLPLPQLTQFCTAFEEATGWKLRYERSLASLGEAWSAPIDGNGGTPSGRLVLESSERSPGRDGRVELHQARALALCVGHLLGEVNRLRQALAQREAELAAGVPITSRSGDEPHLAERLEAVIKGGAEAVGCQAAGLYLLDEATSELKLRAAWGLTKERLLAPARPLRGAVADLEALVGHAVVLEDTALLPHWRCPEEYPSAVCVPVASPTVPLGTLWVFSDHSRDFSPQETNLIEIVAGRLAADLEREMLLSARLESREQNLQFHAAARWQADRLPSVRPLLDDYDVAGWTKQSEELGGDFHDWSILPDGRLAMAVGDAEGRLLEGALSAASLQSLARAQTAHHHSAQEFVARVNESLLAMSPGDQRASLAYSLLDPESGCLELALAGDVAAIAIHGDDRQVIAADNRPLGVEPDGAFRTTQLTLRPGGALLLMSSGMRNAVDSAGLRIGEAALASLASKHPRDSAASLLARMRRLVEHNGQIAEDLTLLVLKRRS